MTSTEYTDVWTYAENAPDYADDVSDLWHWSTNYDAGEGPITLFLDLIGYSHDQFGEPLHLPGGKFTLTEYPFQEYDLG